MAKGVSLLELVVGIVVTGGVGLVIAQFSSNAMQAQKNSNLIAQTEQKMRMFLEVQKKHISASLPLNNDPFNNCRILGVAGVPTPENCGLVANGWFWNLTLQRFRDPLNPQPAGVYVETTTTQCVAPPPRVIIEPIAREAINNCIPDSPLCVAPQVPEVTTTANGAVLRLSGGQQTDAAPTLASALCITHNAPLNPANPASFSLVNLRLRTLVLHNKETRLLEMSASVPTPRLQPGNIRVLSSGK